MGQGRDMCEAEDKKRKEEDKERERREKLLMYGLIAITFVLWLFFGGFLLYRTYDSADGSALMGTFGDSFGVLNALFSGLAFAVIVVSLVFQREDLRLQRKDLRLQHAEIKKANALADMQREEMEAQKRALEQQVATAARSALIASCESVLSHLDETKKGPLMRLYRPENKNYAIYLALSDIVDARDALRKDAKIGKREFTEHVEDGLIAVKRIQDAGTG